MANVWRRPSGFLHQELIGTVAEAAGLDATASPPGVESTTAIGAPVPSGDGTATPAGLLSATSIGAGSALGSSVALPAGVASVATIGDVLTSGAGDGSAVAAPLGVEVASACGTAIALGDAVEVRIEISPLMAAWHYHRPVWPGIAEPLGVAARSAVGQTVAFALNPSTPFTDEDDVILWLLDEMAA